MTVIYWISIDIVGFCYKWCAKKVTYFGSPSTVANWELDAVNCVMYYVLFLKCTN